LEKPQTARITVIPASSWFQNRSTQWIMAGIPEFEQYFEQFHSVVTPELCTRNLESISLGDISKFFKGQIVPIHNFKKGTVRFLFINEQFLFGSRPNKGFRSPQSGTCMPQPETRGERRSGQKGPFRNGN